MRAPARSTPSTCCGTSTVMRYQPKVKPTERLSRMFSQVSHPESSKSTRRGGHALSWAVRPSFGSPGTRPAPNRHWPFTCWRPAAVFRSSAIRGIAPPVRGVAGSIGLVVPQPRDDLLGKQADGAHHLLLGKRAEVELAQQHVEQALGSAVAERGGNGVGRA